MVQGVGKTGKPAITIFNSPYAPEYDMGELYDLADRYNIDLQIDPSLPPEKQNVKFRAMNLQAVLPGDAHPLVTISGLPLSQAAQMALDFAKDRTRMRVEITNPADRQRVKFDSDQVAQWHRSVLITEVQENQNQVVMVNHLTSTTPEGTEAAVKTGVLFGYTLNAGLILVGDDNINISMLSSMDREYSKELELDSTYVKMAYKSAQFRSEVAQKTYDRHRYIISVEKTKQCIY